jgi:glutaredoxin
MPAKSRRLTLIGRRYCSLCDKMRVALFEAARRDGITVALDEIDLDEHPSLEERWGEWVPVLLIGAESDLESARVVCHYHFDQAAWQTLLSKPEVMTHSSTGEESAKI